MVLVIVPERDGSVVRNRYYDEVMREARSLWTNPVSIFPYRDPYSDSSKEEKRLIERSLARRVSSAVIYKDLGISQGMEDRISALETDIKYKTLGAWNSPKERFLTWYDEVSQENGYTKWDWMFKPFDPYLEPLSRVKKPRDLLPYLPDPSESEYDVTKDQIVAFMKQADHQIRCFPLDDDVRFSVVIHQGEIEVLDLIWGYLEDQSSARGQVHFFPNFDDTAAFAKFRLQGGTDFLDDFDWSLFRPLGKEEEKDFLCRHMLPVKLYVKREWAREKRDNSIDNRYDNQ
jgi:hypothetical protein